MTDIVFSNSDHVKFNDEKVRKFLENLGSKVKKVNLLTNDYMVLLNAIVFKDVVRHFETESGPEGRWQAWSSSYMEMKTARTLTKKGKKRKGKRGNIGQILQDTGRLRNNFKPTSFRKQGKSIVWYNNAKTKSGFPYAFAHNTGGPKLPKRQFMWLSNDAISQIEDQTLKFLLGE